MKPILILTNPTDDELNVAVAEHVDGWRYVGMAATIGCDQRMWAKGTPGASDYVMRGQDQFRYATSADAVLPLLGKLCDAWTMTYDQGEMDEIEVNVYAPKHGFFVGQAPLPKAICIALCRANNIEVIFT